MGQYSREITGKGWLGRIGPAPNSSPFHGLAASCPALQAPADGRKFGSKYLVDHEVHFACDPGFQLLGSSTRMCQANGSWTGQEPRCAGTAHSLPWNVLWKSGFIETRGDIGVFQAGRDHSCPARAPGMLQLTWLWDDPECQLANIPGMLQVPNRWDFSVLRRTGNCSCSSSAGEMRGNAVLAMTCHRVPKHRGACSIPEACCPKGGNMERGCFSRRDQPVLEQPLPERRDVPGGAQPLQMPLPPAVDRDRLPVPSSDRCVTLTGG